MKTENNQLCLSKIQFLEKSTSKFICSICLNFSTDIPHQLPHHLAEMHRFTKFTSCIHCCVNVKTAQIADHIERHFQSDTCSLSQCKKCNVDINITKAKLVMDHINESHSGEIQCPECLAEFGNNDDLFYHIKRSILWLYRCQNDNCLVSSHDQESFFNHMMKNGHDDKLYSKEKIIICLNRKYNDDCCAIECNETKKMKVTSDKVSSVLAEINEKVKPNFSNVNHLVMYNLKYSRRVLKKLFPKYGESSFNGLCLSMDKYETFSLGIGFIDDQRYFFCSACPFKTEHGTTDVRKHIMSVHCLISGAVMRECMKCSKIDLHYQTLSDAKMIECINNKRAVQAKKKIIELLVDSEAEEKVDTPVTRKRVFKTNLPSAKKEKKTEIILGHSDKALQHFCKIQSLESVLPELQAKMSIYDTYKAQIIPEGTCKVLQCSGCELSKFRGLYDFTKHVISNHAKVPRIYRDLVKLCCRMDRNYELLHDDLLMYNGSGEALDDTKENNEMDCN